MKRNVLHSMSLDELSKLYEKVAAELAAKLVSEKRVLERRLSQLNGQFQTEPSQVKLVRRPYPRVVPKFRNPDQPSETWAGRGKQPRWLTAQLRSGKRIDDFRIERAAY